MQLSPIIEALLIASQSPLSADELARLVRARVAEALLDGTDGAKVEAGKEAFGLGKGVPDELIRYHELVIRGSVEPRLTRDISVKLAERFPVDHKQLALKILALTGQGHAVKKKPSDCSATPKSAPA